MEHKFGVFDTVEELNRAAAAQKAEGDEEALIALALENGLDREDAEDYMDGGDWLCTPYMAAIGKINLEAAELDLQGTLKDWKDFLIQILTDYEGGDSLADAVFRPEKHLIDVLAAGLKRSSQNRITVDKKIIKAAGLPDSAAYMGDCGRDELRGIIMDYYLGGRS